MVYIRNRGTFHFGWCAFFCTQLACLCSWPCRDFSSASIAKLEPDQVFLDENLASVGGYTQSLQLIWVIQELTVERDPRADGQTAIWQSKNFTWNTAGTKGRSIKRESLTTLSHHHPALKT